MGDHGSHLGWPGAKLVAASTVVARQHQMAVRPDAIQCNQSRAIQRGLFESYQLPPEIINAKPGKFLRFFL